LYVNIHTLVFIIVFFNRCRAVVDDRFIYGQRSDRFDQSGRVY
jgi:hypothetical protein